ncbi:ArsR/SmtB family transcription factor [Brachybacterium sp. DNPG3]
MRTLAHPARDELCIDDVLTSLADPVRRTIVRKLADHAHEQTCVAIELPVAKSTASHHFRILRESGVIRQVYEGASIMNSLRREDLDARFPGLLDAVLSAPPR